MAETKGLEPSTLCVTDRCSNQLSYASANRVKILARFLMCKPQFSLRKNLAIVGCLISLCTSVMAAPVYKLSVTKLAEAKNDIALLALPETVIDSELSLIGDEFSAELSPITTRALRIPRGSRIIGSLSQLRSERSLGRAATALIDIDRLELPNGTIIPAKAQLELKSKSSATNSALKAGSKIGASTLVGAMDALEYGGIATAIMTQGISVGVGAALGLGLGLLGTVTDKGDNLRVDNFNLAELRLVSDFELLEALPEVSAEELDRAEFYRAKLDLISERMNRNTKTDTTIGLDLKFNDIDKYFSASYGEFILVDFDIDNKTSRQVYPQDFAISSVKHLKPVLSNPLIYSDGFTAVKPGERRRCKLAFALGDYDRDDDYKLGLLDPKTQQLVTSYDL